MQACGQQHSGWQGRIKVKGLQVQWVHIRDHNLQSRLALRSMPFMWQLDWILSPWDPSKPSHVFSNMGELLELASWPREKDDNVRKPLGAPEPGTSAISTFGIIWHLRQPRPAPALTNSGSTSVRRTG